MAKGAAPTTRLRDLEEDVFDVAHNNLLRTAADLPVTSRRQMVNSTDWDQSSPSPSSPSRGASSSTAMVCASDDVDPDVRTKMQSVVQDTWEKANKMQEQAIQAAVRTALREAHEKAAVDKQAALKSLEDQLRAEAEKANRRLWEIAARERDAAIVVAIKEENDEVKRLKSEIEKQKERAAAELDEQYQSVKGSMGKVLEEQHTADVNQAVQATWDSARRLEATAIAAARKDARAEADKEWEEKFKLERLERGDELRKSVADAVKATAEEMASTKEELLKVRSEAETLKQELARERVAAREAESRAAKQQQAAVAEAVKAVEAIAKSSQERAITRALAAAGVAPKAVDAS